MASFNSFDQYDANLFLNGMGTTPVIFNQNIIKKSTETNNFINSGIISSDDAMAGQLTAPGEEVILPYSNDLYGEPQAWSDKSNIEVNPITAGQERAVKLRQSQAFGYTDIAQLQQMGDPLTVITDGFAGYWKRVDEETLLKTLDGIFKNPSIAEHNVFDEDKGQSFNPKSFERAVSLLADYQDETFTAIAVHPAVYAEMKANNYLDTVGNDQPLSQAVTPFGTYNGMNIVVDRRMPIAADGTATSYIFSSGAVKYSVATPANSIETYRHPGVRGGQNQIFSKRIYSIHVDGTTVADGYTPLRNTGYGYADLQNPEMWDLVSDPLRVHVVAYKSKVDQGYATKFFDDEADGEEANAAAAKEEPATDQTITKPRKRRSASSNASSTSSNASASNSSSSNSSNSNK